ncbi:hypothetical protein ASD16_11730 [Cellulomonas sp. Root485]|uniref:O-antigen ligase family protein n=1 Tax=Cellulomonas sp. Root485 TaxID=1736546 RepID=UPI0006FDAC02|nr:O-antigen ligase family protein [Cellulomonas sp. Root485]KQY23223.1 hypothetical protein ASD16_11730 [Cellulomonas sp. Root485]
MHPDTARLAPTLVMAGGVGATLLVGIAAVIAGPEILELALAGLLVIGALALAIQRPSRAAHIIVVVAVLDRNIPFEFDRLRLTTTVVLALALSPILLWSALRSGRVTALQKAAVAAIGVGLVGAALLAPEPALSAIGTGRWLLALLFLLAVIGFTSSEINFARSFMQTIVFAGAISGAFGLLQRAGVYLVVGAPYNPGVYDSTFGYYSNFAQFEAVVAVVGLGLTLQRAGGSLSRRTVVAAAALLAAVSVLASDSRGAVVSMGVGFVVVIAVTARRRARAFAAAVAVAGGLALSLRMGWFDTTFDRFATAQGGDNVRAQLQAAGFELLRSHPFGIGFESFSTFVASGVVTAERALSHAHNTYVQVGLDAGLLGLAGFLVLLAHVAVTLLRCPADDARVPAAAAVFGVAIQFTQDYFFFEFASLTLFVAVLGVAVARRPAQGDQIASTASTTSLQNSS